MFANRIATTALRARAPVAPIARRALTTTPMLRNDKSDLQKKAEQTAQKAGETASELKKQAGEKASELSQKVEDAAHTAGNKASELQQKAGDKASELQQKAGEKASELSQKASELQKQANEKTQRIVDSTLAAAAEIDRDSGLDNSQIPEYELKAEQRNAQYQANKKPLNESEKRGVYILLGGIAAFIGLATLFTQSEPKKKQHAADQAANKELNAKYQKLWDQLEDEHRDAFAVSSAIAKHFHDNKEQAKEWLKKQQNSDSDFKQWMHEAKEWFTSQDDKHGKDWDGKFELPSKAAREAKHYGNKAKAGFDEALDTASNTVSDWFNELDSQVSKGMQAVSDKKDEIAKNIKDTGRAAREKSDEITQDIKDKLSADKDKKKEFYHAVSQWAWSQDNEHGPDWDGKFTSPKKK